MARISFPLDPEKLVKGAGLDLNWPTEVDGRVVSAAEAVASGPPSRAMYDFAATLVDYLRARGGRDCDCVGDYQASSTRPGGLMVRWGGDVAPSELAERFGRDGKLPAWLQLLPDDDYDARFLAPDEPVGWEITAAPLGVRSRPSALAGRCV